MDSRKSADVDSQLPFDELRQYFPPVLFHWPGFLDSPEHQVSTLFIDVAGFTALSEMMMRMGPEGAEILERTIQEYFGALLEVIELYDGFPITVAGDSLAVVFACPEGDVAASARQALECAVRLRDAGNKASEITCPEGTVHLGHKIGVGLGSMLSGLVGDPQLHSELAYAGDALDRAAAAEHRASSGQIWACPEVVAEVPRSVWREILPDGFARLQEDSSFDVIEGLARQRFRVDPDPEELREIMLAHLHLLPDAVREHAEEGTLKYISKHQNLTVMFAGCPGMVFNRPESVQQLDSHYRQMQQVVRQYGGYISQFEAGDKGAKLVILFGAPAMLEDPAGQAAKCAKSMQLATVDLGLVSDQRIGLTTGRLFVGKVGCPTLSRFGALGDRVNLAARLMGKAGRNQVLSELHTVELTQQAVRWGKVRYIKVKGKGETIGVSRLLVGFSSRTRERRGRGIVGRLRERRALEGGLNSLLRETGGALFRLEGRPGSGKTRLIEFVEQKAHREGLRVIRQDGSAYQSGTLLSAWGWPLRAFTGVDRDASDEEVQAAYEAWLESWSGEYRRAAEVVAPLIGAKWPEDPVLAGMPANVKLNVRRQSTADLVLEEARRSPFVLIFDDGERLDEQSARLFRDLAPHLTSRQCLVIISHRPPTDGHRNPFASLESQPAVTSFQLEALSSQEVTRLACARLKAKALDTELVALLHTRSAGNPLMVEAWIDFLSGHGNIKILEDTAYLSGLDRLKALPDRLESLVLTELARLPIKAQLAVGVASIFGSPFRPRDVKAVYPEEAEDEQLIAHLRLAAKVGILYYLRGNSPWMIFSRPEYQETIHDSLPFGLRRKLHGQRARQLLAELQGEVTPEMVLSLARHHEYIEDLPKQRRFFEQAVAVCDERYDHLGTVRWARKLIEISDRAGDRRGFLSVAFRLKTALELLGEEKDALAVNERWIREAELDDDQVSLVHALRTSARLKHHIGQTEQALEEMSRALSVAREFNDPELLTDTLINACSIHNDAGRHRVMARVANEALEICPKGDLLRTIKVFSNRGTAYQQMNRLDEALEDYTKALALCEEVGDVWRQAIVIGNIAVVLWAQGKAEEGHARLLKSLDLKRKVGDRREIAISLVNAGYSFYRIGDLQKARSHVEEGQWLLKRLDQLRGVVDALSNLGEILFISGELEEAGACYVRADEILLKHPHPVLAQELNLRRGELAMTRGDIEGAQKHFKAALEAVGSGQPQYECQALEGLAESNRIKGDLPEALRLIRAALSRVETGVVTLDVPQRVWWRGAQILAEMGERDEARAHLEKAVELLAEEQGRLQSATARARIARVFPWNREILAARF